MKAFRKWNDLQQFHEVTKNLNYPRIHAKLRELDYKIPYGLKIKLHGTNACVRIEPDGKVTAQKRSSDIKVGNDNAGFAQWVSDNEYYFSKLANSLRTIYIYGEWAGPGIQNGVACNETDRKYFYVFSLDTYEDGVFVSRIYCPDTIEKLLGPQCIDTIIVIPWHGELTVDFVCKEETQKALSALNVMVEAVGEKDPLINDLFEIEGAGEGVVAYPKIGMNPGISYLKEDEVTYFSWFNFKAKSEAHRVNKTKTAVQFDPEKFASIQLFADAYCTEQRLLQAFTEGVEGRKDMRLTPDFIKWVVTDIYKESKTERETNPELDWKAISKACSSRAVTWYKAKVQEL
jgi:hypothetical protein